MTRAAPHSTAVSGFSSLLASLKLGLRKSKQDLTETAAGPSSPSPKGRRQALSLQFSADEHSKVLDALIEFHQQEVEVKKRSHSIKLRRRSFSKKHLSTYNIDETLLNAVMVGNIELTKQMLLGDNIDINAIRPSGWTALHHACRIGNVKLIKVLVEAGSDPSIVNEEGSTPLRIAVTHGHFDAAFYLIHECGVNCEEIRDGIQGHKKSNKKWEM